MPLSYVAPSLSYVTKQTEKAYYDDSNVSKSHFSKNRLQLGLVQLSDIPGWYDRLMSCNLFSLVWIWWLESLAVQDDQWPVVLDFVRKLVLFLLPF